MALEQLSSEVKSRLRSGVAITSVSQGIEELVLNSIDAEATCMAIRVDMSCCKIQVVDNGKGMSKEALEMVAERYTTSKCHTLQDLDERLQHFGYRGEALASMRDISSVLEIESRSKQSTQSYNRTFQYGKPHPVTESKNHRPSSGTTITVHDLFHRLPVRRKGLNESLELERARQRIEAIALIHPSCSFSFRNDVTGTKILQTHKSNSVLGAFTFLFGNAKSRTMSLLSAELGPIKINGFMGKEGHHNKNMQFIFINDRLVLKTKIHRLINYQLSRSTITKRRIVGGSDGSPKWAPSEKTGSPQRATSERHGVFVINLTCPLAEYDITYDPAKTLVEFKDWKTVLAVVGGMVKGFLEEHSLVVKVDPKDDENPDTLPKDLEEALEAGDSQEDGSGESPIIASLQRYAAGINTANSSNNLASETVSRPKGPKPEEIVEQIIAEKTEEETQKNKSNDENEAELPEEEVPGHSLKEASADKAPSARMPVGVGDMVQKVDSESPLAFMYKTSQESEEEDMTSATKSDSEVPNPSRRKRPLAARDVAKLGQRNYSPKLIPESPLGLSAATEGQSESPMPRVRDKTFISLEQTSACSDSNTQRVGDVGESQCADSPERPSAVLNQRMKDWKSQGNSSQQEDSSCPMKYRSSLDVFKRTVGKSKQVTAEESQREYNPPSNSTIIGKEAKSSTAILAKDKSGLSVKDQCKEFFANKIKPLDTQEATASKANAEKVTEEDIEDPLSGICLTDGLSIEAANINALKHTSSISRVSHAIHDDRSLDSISTFKEKIDHGNKKVVSKVLADFSSIRSQLSQMNLPKPSTSTIAQEKACDKTDNSKKIKGCQLPRRNSTGNIELDSSQDEQDTSFSSSQGQLQNSTPNSALRGLEILKQKIKERQSQEAAVSSRFRYSNSLDEFKKKLSQENQPKKTTTSAVAKSDAAPQACTSKPQIERNTTTDLQCVSHITDKYGNPSTGHNPLTCDDKGKRNNQAQQKRNELGVTTGTSHTGNPAETTDDTQGTSELNRKRKSDDGTEIQKIPLAAKLSKLSRGETMTISQPPILPSRNTGFSIFDQMVEGTQQALSRARANDTLKNDRQKSTENKTDQIPEPEDSAKQLNIDAIKQKTAQHISANEEDRQNTDDSTNIDILKSLTPGSNIQRDTTSSLVSTSAHITPPNTINKEYNTFGKPQSAVQKHSESLERSFYDKPHPFGMTPVIPTWKKPTTLLWAVSDSEKENPVKRPRIQSRTDESVHDSDNDETQLEDWKRNQSAVVTNTFNHTAGVEAAMTETTPVPVVEENITVKETVDTSVQMETVDKTASESSIILEQTAILDEDIRMDTHSPDTSTESNSIDSDKKIDQTKKSQNISDKLIVETLDYTIELEALRGMDIPDMELSQAKDNSSPNAYKRPHSPQPYSSRSSVQSNTPGPAIEPSQGFSHGPTSDTEGATSERSQGFVGVSQSQGYSVKEQTQEFSPHSPQPEPDEEKTDPTPEKQTDTVISNTCEKGKCTESEIEKASVHRTPANTRDQEAGAKTEKTPEKTLFVGPSWICKLDPNTGRKIFINKITGHSSFSTPPKSTDEEGKQPVFKLKNPVLPSGATPLLQAESTPLHPRPKELRTRQEDDGGSTEVSDALAGHLEKQEEEEATERRVKWRDGSVQLPRDEGTSVRTMLEEWENPVFKIVEQCGLNVDARSSTKGASRVQQAIHPYKFDKDVFSNVKILGQVDNKFIACRMELPPSGDGNKQELLTVIDQHAAHERVRLERLTAEAYADDGSCIDQRDVDPAIKLTLKEDEVRVACAYRSALNKKGLSFRVDSTKRTVVHIYKVPTCLMEREVSERRRKRNTVPVDLLETLFREETELLSSTHGAGANIPQAVFRVLCSQACHGAIKFGDPLTRSECEDLVQQLSTCKLPFQCAHGRPAVAPILDLGHLKPHQDKIPRIKLWKLREGLDEMKSDQ